MEIKRSQRYLGDGIFADRDYLVGDVIFDWSKDGIPVGEIEFYANLDYYDNAIQIGPGQWIYHETAKKMNHSCSPNCKVINQTFVAAKNINKGEECTYDYSTSEDSRWESRFRCLCQEPNCRKTIKSYSKLAPDQQGTLKKTRLVSNWIMNKSQDNSSIR